MPRSNDDKDDESNITNDIPRLREPLEASSAEAMEIDVSRSMKPIDKDMLIELTMSLTS